ncbi:unnamed protein product [Acanthoscelides obtectus]|uniref:Uncharacterized protein n=1 Tax=Acanthoscelides obtectus TaxID=200917 RepID=A0A9P0JPW0_ACAOB|nr:unnamed protein product [Acanthoscelides obtectus]CAK1679121.1 hypothetical protein AOBTE_LOCUS32132 [Acanthoscelides obtectus]
MAETDMRASRFLTIVPRGIFLPYVVHLLNKSILNVVGLVIYNYQNRSPAEIGLSL